LNCRRVREESARVRAPACQRLPENRRFTCHMSLRGFWPFMHVEGYNFSIASAQ
jgi:hypothetical protein